MTMMTPTLVADPDGGAVTFDTVQEAMEFARTVEGVIRVTEPNGRANYFRDGVLLGLDANEAAEQFA